jgi:CDP-glucose 4,6-dehydratase
VRDILDFKKINDYIKKNKIDICIHLAGESIVEKGQSDPYSTFRINIDGTLNVLEAARNNKLDRIIIASSSHVYGKNRVPYYEGYTPRPSRPYETSKACVDLIAQSYADTYNLPVLIPRFVNIYGPQDINYTRLIPKTIKSILTNESPEMWGGNAVRDYLYIDDAVNAFIALMKVDIRKVGKNRVFNFGTGNLTSVRDLMEKILKISSSNLPIKKIGVQREDEIKNQYVAVSKAKKLLAWTPKVDIDKGLSLTIAWYKDNV